MATATPVKRDGAGNLVLEESKTNLAEIVQIVRREFPGETSFDLIYFPRPDYRNEEDDLLVGEIKPHDWQAVQGGFQTSLFGLITLAQVIQQVDLALGFTLADVKLLWDKQGFHLSMRKH